MKNINATATKSFEIWNNSAVTPITSASIIFATFFELDNTIISKLSGTIHNCTYKNLQRILIHPLPAQDQR